MNDEAVVAHETKTKNKYRFFKRRSQRNGGNKSGGEEKIQTLEMHVEHAMGNGGRMKRLDNASWLSDPM